MAKIFCPRCGGAGLTIEADGYLRCDRILPTGKPRQPGEPEAIGPMGVRLQGGLEACGYRGFEALVKLDKTKDVEQHLARILANEPPISISMIDGLSVDTSDGVAEFVESMPGLFPPRDQVGMSPGHRLYDSPMVKSASWRCDNVYCDFQCGIGLDISIAIERHEEYLREPSRATASAHLPGLEPEAVAVVPDVRERLEAVAEQAYADEHGVKPPDLTARYGRETAHRLIPAIQAFAAEVWRDGFGAAEEAHDGMRGTSGWPQPNPYEPPPDGDHRG